MQHARQGDEVCCNINPSAVGQNKLIKVMFEEFYPRCTPGGELV